MTEMRPVRLWQPRVRQETRDDGTILVWQEEPLGPYPRCLSEKIAHWAGVTPDHLWMAERDDAGDWRGHSYAELADLTERVGGALLDLGLSVDRPLLILSGNSLDHAVIALSAQHVGIPSAAIAPAYALTGPDYPKLADIARQITPGAVFADRLDAFAPAIRKVLDPDLPIITGAGELPGHRILRWDDFKRTEPTEAARAAARAVTPDTVAKFLFTSGTTGSPKAVITTQRMLCSNMAMVQDCYAFMKEEPPVLVDWAPWNHVASGSKVFNMALYNGGTFYIDKGNPGPQGIEETIRNLREIAPTWYFNVPVGYDALIRAMQADTDLARTFFSRVKLLLYAGAGMATHTWEALKTLSEQTVGARTLLSTGLGATETAPFALTCVEEQDLPGNVGVPAKGVTIKLVPTGGKLELRIKGPLVTPGYWRAPELTAQAFDEEGFYKLGDAVRFAVPGDAAQGFFFDGRIAENFKLNTGTWVAVGALRAKLVDALGGLARDAVITGEGQNELGALLVPSRAGAEALVPDGAALDDAALWSRPEVRTALQERLARLAQEATGSSMRIARAIVMIDPLDLNAGEVTDKGSVNQRAVLNNRGDLVRRLYAGDPEVILARSPR
ncbi:feruloyl-CoA synthase [Mameliella alba]|uniref:Feruloyl-CoA synthase n=1 Tax=Mameliella alba TaxID=561184 RepID=A0A0B3RSE1_9RHOB|nr:feruloyl-CoA synthase [Mameliella alba]KHQ50887.1 Feruloyl-CoA synthase [Mameliella alba]